MEELFTTTVISNADEPFVIVLDPENSQLYWVDTDKNRIQRSDIYGRNITSVLSIDSPSSLDLDAKNRLVLLSYILYS